MSSKDLRHPQGGDGALRCVRPEIIASPALGHPLKEVRNFCPFETQTHTAHPAPGEVTSPSWLARRHLGACTEVGESTPAKPRHRRDVFHFSPGLWRLVDLTAPTRSTCERQEPLREEPASRRPQGLGGPGRSGRRLRLYGAAEGRSAAGSPADCEASRVWLSCGGPGGEGRGQRAAFKGRLEGRSPGGRGSGLRAGRAGSLWSQSRTPTSSSRSRSRSPGPGMLLALPRRQPAGVWAEEVTVSLT